MRTILVHLNIEIRDDDPRDDDDICGWIEQALEDGLPGGRVQTSEPPHLVVIAGSEEI